jgi:murein DD-endopeptidase MepM/ murein hydrolase activator NlpD
MAWCQQVDSTSTQTTDTDSPVIPPAPLIQKKNPNAISIPTANPVPKYQQEPAALSSPGVAGPGAANLKLRIAGSAPDQAMGSGVSTNAKLGSGFGYRRDPFTRRARFHAGCDIKAHWGQPVGASLPGRVQFVGWYHGYGNMIIVEHGGGVATHYAHLSSFAVEVGEHVERGSIIGYAGSTGRATSPHLHYEVRIDGSAVNPVDAIALDESSEFFKNVAAARLAQSGQSAEPAKTDSTKLTGEPVKAATSNQTGAPKAGAPAPAAQPVGSGAAVPQERPRRVTPQD